MNVDQLLKLLKYAPQAKGAYGSGPGTPALSTGDFSVDVSFNNSASVGTISKA